MSLLQSIGVKSGQMVRTNDTIINEADGINDDGSRNVRVVGSKTASVVFHDSAASVGLGTSFPVGEYKTLTLVISGTATSAKVEFKCVIAGVSRTLTGFSDPHFSSGTYGGMGVNESVWSFDISGRDTVTMEITAITGGNVSVKGTVVS